MKSVPPPAWPSGKLRNAVSAHPGGGSLRYANLLDVPGLRHRKLGRYRYLVLYVERDTWIDVWQILHANMDILNRLRDPDAPGEVDTYDALSRRLSVAGCHG